ncbi:MAG: hypothetical protein JKY66_06735 [Spongiibacteraceae bacterium]|nr:hypothetical protein [Spongiibacteraceae bacterium]
MNLDDEIKRELKDEAEKIDKLLDTQGMFDLVVKSYKGGLGRWMMLVSAVILIVSGFMIWTCYNFVVANNIDERLFWGIWFIATLIAQVGMKQWVWLEINRNSLLREVKRVEVALAILSSKIEKSQTDS